MPNPPDKIPENIDFAAEELADADPELREAMLEQIAKSLTRKLLRENHRLGLREISRRVQDLFWRFAIKFRNWTGSKRERHELSPPTTKRA